jgi:signal peptidase I
MFDFTNKKQPAFGVINVDDDKDIEVHKMQTASRQGIWIEVFKLLRDVLLVLSVFMLLLVFVVQPVVVEGTSMLPTLHQNERLIVNKMIYYKLKSFSWGHIERGDVVVFWYPKDPDKSYVKRVIGLPGDTIEVTNGVVYVNGEVLYENYLDSTFNQSHANHELTKVDEHYYYMMGDNRDNSADSRIWGLVPEKYIYGKVFFRYWTPSTIGFIPRGDYQLIQEKEGDVRVENEAKSDEK